MRRPPYSLWGGRDGEIAIDDQADSGDEYLLWVGGKGRTHRGRGRRQAECYEDSREWGGRWVLPGEKTGSTPRGSGQRAMTEPRRVWRFLPSGMSACRNLRSWAAGWVRHRRRGTSLDVALMPCASSPVFRPAGRLIAMTACQGIVTAAPLNMELRQPAFLRHCACRHCGAVTARVLPLGGLQPRKWPLPSETRSRLSPRTRRARTELSWSEILGAPLLSTSALAYLGGRAVIGPIARRPLWGRRLVLTLG